jgi:hypothetical protein
MTGKESFITDQAAGAAQAVFGPLMEYLADHGVTSAGKADKISTVAGSLLAYAQYFATHALFTPTVSMENGPPLPRTKSATTDGEQRKLVFTAKMEMDNHQWVNCFRFMLNAAGVDFNLPPDGAYPGADVQWSIDKGADLFEWAPGSNPRQNNVTNEQGQTDISIIGKKQKRSLSETAAQVTKTAAVRAEYALKKNSLSDFLDTAWKLADGAEILITLPVELLNRTHSRAIRYTFPVQDWTDDVLYVGTAKATFSMPVSGMKFWEITANVTFVKDEGQSTDTQDVYITAQGELTLINYVNLPGCITFPESFTNTYPILVNDGTLIISRNVEPLQYSGRASLSASTPLKTLRYQQCCPGSECTDKTIEPDEQQHPWLYTGGMLMSAQPDGTLQGTYAQPYGPSYEWKFTTEDNNL